jgi:chaperonin GroES
MATKSKSNKNRQTSESSSDHPLANCAPRGDRVVVRRSLPKTQTRGGLFLPDSVAATMGRRQIGTVVRVGPGRLLDNGQRAPIDLSPGDRVIITGYAGMEINDPAAAASADEYLLLREEDVVAVLGPEWLFEE